MGEWGVSMVYVKKKINKKNNIKKDIYLHNNEC